MKRYSFDIDGTICQNTYGEYKKCVPYIDRIEKINQLFEEGNFIIYFTARGMGSCDGNAKLAIQKYYSYTWEQLKAWNCKFHQLYLGKPNADLYIDDRAMNDIDFFEKLK